MNLQVVSIGHNRLNFIARKIQEAYERVIKGGQDWIEASLQLAVAFKEGRDAMPADIAFKDWLKQNNLDFYNHMDRAALINLASNLDLAKQVLSESKSRSYQLIWREDKHRFISANKPVHQTSRRPRTRNMGRAMIYRRMKLGDETIDKLKGTSLDSAQELDELVALNRGAAEGEHTEIVKHLIAEAIAGKDISAVAEGQKLVGAAPKKARTLIEAWRKRMIFVWEQANKKEQEQFIEYLMNHIKGE
jgi:hypothetical protein